MSAHREIGSKTHVPALDGVRGVAILAVLAYHFASLLPESGPSGVLKRALHGGMYGVDLFFVLSGFLITGILVDTRGVGARGFFGTFFARRFVRIFPLYYAYLAVVLLAVGPVSTMRRSGVDPLSGVDPAWYLAYLSNWSPNCGAGVRWLDHLWSLAVEEQFYVVWPWVVYFVPRRALAPVCLVGAGASFAMRAVAIEAGADFEVIHRLTPYRADTLLIGAALALAVRSEVWRPRLSRWLAPTLALSIGLAALGFGLARIAICDALSWTAVAMMAGCVVFFGATTGRASRALRSPALAVPGKYSYGLYVWHSFLLATTPAAWVPARSAPAIGLIAVEIALTVAVTALSWRLIESPMLRLKRHFAYAQPRLLVESTIPAPHPARAESIAVGGA